MVLRFALISLVLATWLMMPQSTEQSEQPGQTDVAASKPSAVIEPTKEQISETSLDEKRAAKRKRRREKKLKRKKEKRRKAKDKRRRQKRRRKGKKNLKRRKDKLRKKARKLRRKKMRSRKNKNKKKSKKFKKRLKKLKKKKNKRQSRRRKEKRGERRRGVRRIRRGRKKKKQFCRTDSECRPGQCCKGNICADPGKGLKCFGPCMCQGREKTKNFICVTKKRVMEKYLKRFGNDTNRPFRGRCRNITLTELEDPNSKFVVVKAPKLENRLNKPRL